jgi:bifunctional non-homologous end joining protein LigD
MNSESVTLYYCKGSSDKVYQALLEPSGAGWVVNYAHGRRGASMQTGSRTDEPLGYGKAKVIYDKLVRRQLAKGYTPGEAGTPYQSTPKEKRSTGIIPQLLNAIDLNELSAFVLNPAFAAQEKFDGRRALIRGNNGSVDGINRSGLVVALPQPIAQAVSVSQVQSVILDGELVGDFFIAFDILELNGKNVCELPYQQRLAHLSGLGNLFGDLIRLAETAVTGAEKRAMCDRLRKEEREGVVFKDLRAPYSSGRPASGGTQRKCKFYETASFLVSAVNGQRSVALSLFKGEQRIAVGNVTIPVNASIPHAGELVEVRYLYAFENGSVYQPVYLGKRDDLKAHDCQLSQLKLKKT